MPPKDSVIAYVVDLMALVRVQSNIPVTYKELSLQLFKSIPQGYKRVDIVADTYRQQSIKDPECMKRGCSERVIVQSAKSRIPRNFSQFLQNGNNKTRLIELVLSTLLQEKDEILHSLKSEKIYFSADGKCHYITKHENSVVNELSSNQEEADTKICLHAKHALGTENDGHVIIRNHSGNVDINVILLSKINSEEEASRVILDTNKGKNRKVIHLSDVNLSTKEKSALIGFHAFTGNDYTSAFFGKGKHSCWKIAVKNEEFLEVFSCLGDDWFINDDQLQALENFVYWLYGNRHFRDINKVRLSIFQKVYKQKNKIIDLPLLPPCQQTLKLHCRQCNYVAKIWKSSDVSVLQAPPIVNHGWNEEYEIKWAEIAFPDDVEEILSLNEESGYEESDSDSSEDESDEDL